MLDRAARTLRRAAFRLAPRKILAYNTRLERHHLRLNLASLLFWRGVRSPHLSSPALVALAQARAFRFPARISRCGGPRVLACARRVAVLSPYVPYPLSHGGAVRIYNLLREMARRIRYRAVRLPRKREEAIRPAARYLRAHRAGVRSRGTASPAGPRSCRPKSASTARLPCARPSPPSAAPSGSSCSKLNTRIWPNTVRRGDTLVEHDVNFDLFGQIARRERTLSARWDYYRWRRFERRWTPRYRRVVVMSKKDADLLGPQVRAVAIENGVDMERFRPAPEPPGQRLLFIGSFQHFPERGRLPFFHGARLAAAAR